MSSNESTAAAAQSFRDWSHAKPLSEVLARAEAGVRGAPQDAGARWLLFELLCVQAQWERALSQLRAWSSLDKKFDSTAHVLRGLVAAERQRAEVFAGRVPPKPLTLEDQAPHAFMHGLGEALHCAAKPGLDAAAAAAASDEARDAALSQAPATPGSANLQPAFAWIADSDTRLGPVCEIIAAGAYRWLAFADMASIEKAAPASLLDLVWSQVDITLSDGTALACHMPMRYPVLPGDRDALLLARETVWTDVGSTGVFARGQQTWSTDVGDMPLLDMRSCRFGATNDGLPSGAGDLHAAG